MLKYINTKVVFQEIPNEITLAINISGCPIRCPDCHSKYLWDNIGEPLGYFNLMKLINDNKGITCVAFMGGDANFSWIAVLAFKIKREFPELKIAWYSGNEELPKSFPLQHFDVIKLGRYDKTLGPLNCPTTNQRFYRIINNKMYDYTYIFWNNSDVEVWRDIDGFNGYQVSNLGNVRSLNYNGTGNTQLLRPSLSGLGRGYKSVSMQVEDVVIRRNIHRLVARAFIPNPNDLPEINHIDEDGTNNRVNNLEWCDRAYNLNYGNRTQKFIDAKSIPILQYSLDNVFIKEWKSQTEICKELGLDKGSLSHCLHGYRVKEGVKCPVYSYAGYKWKYKNIEEHENQSKTF